MPLSDRNNHLSDAPESLKWPEKNKLLSNIIAESAQKAQIIYVAFSGGVDSSYLLLKAAEICGSQKVVAITVKTPTDRVEDIQHSEEFTRNLGIKHEIISAPEFDDPLYRRNDPLRCYYCKLSRYRAIAILAEKQSKILIFDGTQADDNPDERPGSKAVEQLGVMTPLAQAGINKTEIRQELACRGFEDLSRKNAEPCFSTRIPFGRPIIEAELEQVMTAERFLKENGIKLLRVRHHGNLARIVTNDFGQRLLINDVCLKQQVSKYFQDLGFQHVTVDLQEYGHGA